MTIRSSRIVRTATGVLLLAGATLGAQVPASAPPAGAPVPITIDEAVRLAQRNAPAAIQARGSERSSRAAVRSAYGAFLPSVNVSLGRTRNWADPTSIDLQTGQQVGSTTYSSGVSLSATLFEGRRLFQLANARATVTAAEASQVAQEFTVALDVSQQYYNALAARESEAAAQQQLALAQQQLRYSAARVQAGVATKSDSLRSMIQVGTARLALLTAQTNLRAANASLTRLIGSDVTVTAVPEDSAVATLDSVALDTTSLLRLALEGPAVRQARANLSAARATRRAAAGAYLPSITASYTRGGSGLDSRFGLGDTRYSYRASFGLGLSYPLFNGFTREQTVVQADVAEDNASAALRDAQLQARALLVQNVDQLRTAQESARVQQLSVAAAEEDLRVQQQRYNAGASTLLDVLTSQTQLAQAQTALIQARFNARVARARLESLIGQRLTPAAPR